MGIESPPSVSGSSLVPDSESYFHLASSSIKWAQASHSLNLLPSQIHCPVCLKRSPPGLRTNYPSLWALRQKGPFRGIGHPWGIGREGWGLPCPQTVRWWGQPEQQQADGILPPSFPHLCQQPPQLSGIKGLRLLGVGVRQWGEQSGWTAGKQPGAGSSLL